jgi:hypothetical protein
MYQNYTKYFDSKFPTQRSDFFMYSHRKLDSYLKGEAIYNLRPKE